MHAAAAGRVLLAEDLEGGWGNVVQVVHRLPEGAVVQTQYAHLDRIDPARFLRARRPGS